MIFSLHHVIDSLAGMLTGAYPDYPVYDSPNQQGTSFPCFFLFFIPSTIEEHVGNHFRFQCRISSGVLKMKSCTTSSISGRGSWWKKRKT